MKPGLFLFVVVSIFFILSIPSLGEIQNLVSNKTIPLSECSVLDKSGGQYKLQNNVESRGTCFILTAPNVSLDLNGFSVIYDNGTVPSIPNGNFEKGSSSQIDDWDISKAPRAQRIFGTYVKPVTVYSGNHSLKISLSSHDQVVRSKEPIVFEPNTTYSLSGMIYNMMNDKTIISFELEGTDIRASKTGKTWRGFQYVHVRFTTKEKVTPSHILIRVSSAGEDKGYIFIDDLKFQRHRVNGIAIGPEAWRKPSLISDANKFGNAPSATIKNGKIIQGNGKSDYSHAISIGENSGISFEINNLDISVQGANSKAISSYNAINSKISNVTINSNVDTITSRDHYDGALIFIDYPGFGSKIFKNTITRGIQTGIYLNSLSGKTPNQIYENTITLQTKYTNDFAIIGNGSIIYNNIIECGEKNNSCRGIWAGGKGTRVYENTISVQQLPRNQEYNGCQLSGAYGIQSENGFNTEVYNNTVTALAGDCEAVAFRANPMEEGKRMGSNNIIRENTFKSIAKGTARAVSVKIGEADGNSLELINNKFQSNRCWLLFDGHATDLIFLGNRFEKIHPKNGPFTPLETSNWNGLIFPENITFLNNQYHSTEDSSEFKGASFKKSQGLNNDIKASYVYSWGVTIHAVNRNNLPLLNASITIKDKSANQVFSGVTDFKGKVIVSLREYKNIGGKKILFNPYTILLQINNNLAVQTIEADQQKTIIILSTDY